MALDDSALSGLLELLRHTDAGQVMRELLRFGLQALVDAEADAHVGAARYERSAARTTQRNGSRERTVSTTAGDLTVKIPKMRTGSFFPSLLEPRRRIDVALHAVVMEAYVHGVSTRKVDDLVAALGVDAGISKSEVSWICAALDREADAWRARRLDHVGFPYVYLDATYCKVRLDGRVVSQAVVIATGVSADGRREVLGVQVGDSEDEAFWTEFLRGLRDRGLVVGPVGVRLVISDAHRGLTAAVGKVLTGASWQRCRVHFQRNVAVRVPRHAASMVTATIGTIFAQPTADLVRAQVDTVADLLHGKFPAVAGMLGDAKADLTAFADFPEPHWRKIWSNNPLERLNREVKRRTDVVGIFPNREALLRLATAVLMETHDEWQVSDRRYLSEESMRQIGSENITTTVPEIVPITLDAADIQAA
ncbi:IS256 family transposase [Frankia sp. AgPm24]|uniref:IS256 family transposase n=1 Tax=Frankia sp. AgPm24 TaxID=631128 RepID=UPI00200FB131|nr:IS256 family transposase [Frankia sp. AgPm24]MCK9921187.1 IS256 family transposase [Frankia sp. AgPm24]